MRQPIPTLEEFQSWPTEQVAEQMRRGKSKVCGFPINGTRRWFILEHPELAASNFMGTYLHIAWQRHIELYKLLFDHGIETLLTPIFGADLLKRGEAYEKLIEPGLLWLARNQDMLDFYDAWDVRVRVYGDYRRYMINTPLAPIVDAFEELAQRTASHRRYRLLFGVCAEDALDTIASIVVQLYTAHGQIPTKRQIVEAYYGMYIEPVDLFIGFERPAVFDIPLLLSGYEDLYFTISPSPYLDQWTLRAILYDHLYCRRVNESSYDALTQQDWQAIKEFYTLNRQQVIGIGRTHKSGTFWYPLPHPIILPPGLTQE